ncbi:pentatricopeptide repeat-containing protein At5g66520-like [Nymphaea colorata]|nr:pentatricopeptide repeat-containing protein At5g66520-like [Nymphaea colorata]
MISTLAGKFLPPVILQKCATMKQLKQIHAHFITAGLLDSNVFLLGRLFAFCADTDSGDLDYAHLVFTQIRSPDIFFVNTIIRGYSTSPTPTKSIQFYTHLLRSRQAPDLYTFPFVLKACTQLSDVWQGETIHGQAIKFGFSSYVYVGNALIHMYGFCGHVETARQLFDGISERDVVSWNSMISVYAKLGDAREARSLFDAMPERNVISWSAMIACYVQQGSSKDALNIFSQMQADKVMPHKSTLVSVLSACAHLGALEQGKWVHAFVGSNGMKLSVVLGTALIDMYSKCGCVDLALKIFHEMHEKNLLAWTTMIKGLAMHGRGHEAVNLFTDMLALGIEPDDIAFIGALSACTHAGLVAEGRQYFEMMSTVYNVSPKIEHYGCMVDLLARVGQLDEAREMVETMPMCPDSLIWGALLAGCKFHGNVELAESVAKHLIQLEPENCGVYVLLANIYAASGRHGDARKLREKMKTKRLMKTPGCSVIEINGTIHQFLVGDTSHPQIKKIQAMWEGIG